MRRSVDDDLSCGADLARYQSRRGSRCRLRRHSLSTPIPKQQVSSLSLVVLLRSILIICIVTQISVKSSVSASSPRRQLTTRAAFCSHNTRRQTTPSLGNIMYIGPPQHSTLAIQRGSNVLSFTASSVSALGLTGKTSADETINLPILNGDVPSEDNNEQLSHEENNLCKESTSTSAESDSPLRPHSKSPSTSENNETTYTAAQREDRAFFARVTVLFSIVVLAVLRMSPSGCWRYYLAGGICASTSHAITTPIDVVKVSCCVYMI